MPNPDGSETAAEAAARIAAAAAAKAGSSSADDTAALRQWLRDTYGIPLPTTTADLLSVAGLLKKQIDATTKMGTGFLTTNPTAASMTTYVAAMQKTKVLQDQLMSYAIDLFGTTGDNSVGSQVSEILRPAAPNVQKLPTAEEFLGDFQNAFATHITNMKASGSLTPQEAEFATNQLQNDYLQKYTGKLGQLAAAGVQPYTLGEVTREQRGTASGTPAGNALDLAYGKGVTEPTTISASSGPKEQQSAGNKVSMQAAEIGTGVPQEFTSTAVIKPLDFLQQQLTPASIKLAYAGSQYGAGKVQYGQAPPGFISSPRRA